ncbi:hypothetical protein [Umezawaea sp. NPDC059074]|uniref:hypothetical protein n=1 Tax=Umezawaea sp. NPDC059074 TaxID=3346716 RepID=UPI0036929D61
MVQQVPAHGFAVDVEALAALTAQMRDLRERLDRPPRTAELDVSQSGSHVVTNALRDFISRWEDGRARIRENLESNATALDAALLTYRTMDSDIAAGMTPTSADPGRLR